MEVHSRRNKPRLGLWKALHGEMIRKLGPEEWLEAGSGKTVLSDYMLFFHHMYLYSCLAFQRKSWVSYGQSRSPWDVTIAVFMILNSSAHSTTL